MSKIKTCIVCGKKYEYCGHCDKGGQENRWKSNYCSENCRDIFDIVSKYVNHHIQIEEAKQELLKKDLGINIKNNIAKYCGEIMTYEKEENTESEVIEDTKEEATEVTNEVTPSIKSEFKSKRRRRQIKE